MGSEGKSDSEVTAEHQLALVDMRHQLVHSKLDHSPKMPWVSRTRLQNYYRGFKIPPTCQ